jgi:glycosyltransferase involved in cell wall biosynthesis
MIKILYDARFITPDRTGVGRLTESLLKALSNGSDTLSIDALYFDPVRQIQDIRYCKAPVRFDSHPWGDLYRNSGLIKKIHRSGYDLFFSPAFYCIQRKLNIPQIVAVHDLAVFDNPDTFSKRFVIYFRSIIASTCKRADRIITSSQFIADRIASRFPHAGKKVVVVPYGVSQEFFHVDSGKQQEVREKWSLPKRCILTVSTIEPRKNLMVLLNAYAVYRRRTKDPAPLIIIGKDGFRADVVRKRAAQSDMKFAVRFLDYVQETEMPVFYSLATLFVYPSLYEGFGLPVLEAMAAGCPVITSNQSSLPEVTGSAAKLIDPKNQVEIADAMVQLMESDEDREHFRGLGVKRAREFTWERTATGVYTQIRELISNSRTEI